MTANRVWGPAMAVSLAMLLNVPTAGAQAACTMAQIAGTYAFESHGSITSALQPVAPIDWSMVSRPFIFVGSFTVDADGPMAGEGWVILGRISSGLVARPFVGQLVELDQTTCTAVLEWVGSPAPGAPAGLHRERLVFVYSGREFRSMLKQSPSGTMAWTGRGHRIASTAVGTCGPHLLKGGALIQCEAIGAAGTSASAASMSMLTVAGDGSFTGLSFVKDPTYSELPVEGALDVQPNCAVEAWLQSPSLPGLVNHGRGMVFETGKRGFLIMPLESTLPDSSTVRPVFARCDLLSTAR